MFRKKSEDKKKKKYVEKNCAIMILRIKKPEYVGVYKLDKKAQRVACKNLINRKLKLHRSFGQEITAVIIYDGNEEYFINLNLKK